MVRNFDIYRAILQRLEDCETPNCILNAKDLAPYGEQEVAYHMRMLHERGMIEANIIESSDGSNLIVAAQARRITDSGHDFLNTMRNDNLWSRMKTHFKERSVDMTIELVTAVGKRLTDAMLT
jgi:hypothetical protein